MDSQDALLDTIIELKAQLREMLLQHFITYELFSWVWWLEIIVIISAFVIWWKIVDKKRLLEICVFGLLVNITATFLDVLGTDYVLWEYPVHVLPQLPLLIPIDYVVVPIIDMIIYQKYAKWSKYVIASTVTAAILAFIAEPMAVFIGLYELITWKFIYSFPIYILINIAAKFSTEWFIFKQSISIKRDAHE